MYYNTGDNKLYYWNGTAWVTSGGGTTEVNISAAGPSPRVGELLWVDTDEPGMGDPWSTRFYSRQVVGADHSDGVSGWQTIQGFVDTTVPVTRAAAIYRVMWRARALGATTGYTHNIGLGINGAQPGDNVNIGFGPYTVPFFWSEWAPGAIGTYTLRPWVQHAAGSGFLTLSATMFFVVEEVR
jgi:hypothetical protein